MSKELSLAIKIGGKVDSSLNSAFSAVQKGISGATKAMAAATVAGVGAVAAITKKAIDVGSGFEQAMSQVQATMLIDTNTADGVAAYETLENAARQCGRETAFSATEAAEGLNYLALAGYSAEKAATALPTVLRLAGAGAMELADASDMVTDAMSALGIEATQTNLESFADKMAKTASVSNTSVAQLGEAILTVGGTAKDLAGGTTELNVALGILADNGIKAAEGGTHLRNMILSLQSPRNSDAAAMFEKMGLSAYDAQGNMRSLGDVFGDLNKQMAGLSAADVNNTLSTIFKQTDLAAARAMLAATADSVQSLGSVVDASLAQNGQSLSQLGINLDEMAKGFDSTMTSEQFAAQMMQQYGMDAESAGLIFEGLSSIVEGTGNRFDELTGKVNDSVGACQEMYNIQLDNLKGDLAILNSAAEDLYISIFKEINPGLRSMVQLGQEMLGKLSTAFDEGGLSGMVGAIGEVIADAVDAIADVAPKAVEMGVSLVTSFVEGIASSAGKLGNVASDIGSTFISGMFNLIPTVLLTGIDIAVSFAEGIVNGLPGIMESGATAIGGFVDGLVARGPEVINTALSLARTLAVGIVQNAPALISAGTELITGLITGLADGIANNLPEIVEISGEMVESISTALIEAAPKLLEAGKTLIEAAGKGISDSVKHTFDDIKNGSATLSEVAVTFAPFLLAAGKITPALGKAKSAVSGFLTVAGGIGSKMKLATQVLTNFPYIAHNFITEAGGMKNAISGLFKGGLSKIGGAFKAIASPAGITIAVIAALTAAFLHLWNTNEGFRTAITGIWNQITSTIQSFSQNIVSTLNDLGFDFENVGQAISAAWNAVCSLLAPVFVGAFQFIADFLSATLNTISGIVKMFVSAFNGDWSGCWEAAKSIVSGTWEFIYSTIDNIGNTICGVINAFLGLIGSDWTVSWEGIKTTLSGVWSSITGVIDGALNIIKGAISVVMDIIHGDWSSAWEKISSTASTVANAIPGALSGAWEMLKSGISAVGSTIGTLLDAGWEMLKSNAVSFVSGIPGAISAGWETLKSGISAVGSTIGPLLDEGWNTLKSNATSLVGELPGAVSEVWETLKSGISAVGSTIGPLLDEGWNTLKTNASTAVGELPGLVSEGFDTMVSNISDIGSNLGGLLDAGWELLKGAATNAADAVKSAWEGVKDFFGGIWNAITGGGSEEVAAPTVDTSGLSQETQMQIQIDSAQVDTANTAVQTLVANLKVLQALTALQLRINTGTLVSSLSEAGRTGGTAFTSGLDGSLAGYTFNPSSIGVDTAALSGTLGNAGQAGGTAFTNGLDGSLAGYAFDTSSIGVDTAALTATLGGAGATGGTAFTNGLDGSLAGYAFDTSSIGVDTATLSATLGAAGTTGGTAFTSAINDSIAGFSVDTAIGVDTSTVVNNMSNAGAQGSSAFASSLSNSLAGQSISTSAINIDTGSLATKLSEAGNTSGKALTDGLNNSLSGYSFNPSSIGVDTAALSGTLGAAGTTGGTAFTTSLSNAMSAYTFDANTVLPVATLTQAGTTAGQAGGTALGSGINAAVGAYNFNPDDTGMTVQRMTQQGQQSGRAGGTALTQALTAAIQSGSGAVVGAISSMMASVNGALNAGWSTARASAASAMASLQATCASGAAAAANAVRSAFANMHITIPRPSIPVISVSTSSIGYGKGGSVTIPHFSVSWNALGGIFNSPTILPTLQGLQGVGEAGPEAILPLDTLWKRMEEIMSRLLSNNTEGIIGNLLGKLERIGNTNQTGQMEVAGTGMTINFSPTYVLQGSATKEDAKEAAKMTFNEFKKFMEQYDREKKRKGFK